MEITVDEASWQKCRDPGLMLQCVRGKASDRKLRLFACACWRAIAGPVRPIVEFAERLADDPKVFKAATNLKLSREERTLINNAWEAARDATSWRAEIARQAVRHQLNIPNADTATCWEAWTTAQHEWAAIAREIFGSPYRKLEVPRQWTLNVIELANAIYHGQDCAFALHDAVTEAGQPEVAEHFAAKQWHPRGCWAVDLILAKK